jgi:hypothetical protein
LAGADADDLVGHFSPIEIGLTIVIGIACVCGIVLGLRWRTEMSTSAALGAFVLFAALQLAALRLSFLPNIANQ